MKLNKKVLASSLTAAVALLGAVAPATGVFAASSTVKNATDVNLGTAAHLGAEGADALAGALAQDGAETGLATATSDAQVGVVADMLTLDAVPDFNFGNAIPGQPARLHSNQGATPDDGNNRGLLQISDSRTAKTTTTTTEDTYTDQDGNPVYKISGDGETAVYNTKADGTGTEVTAGNVTTIPAGTETTTATPDNGAGYRLFLNVGPFAPLDSNNQEAATGDAAAKAVQNGFILAFDTNALNEQGANAVLDNDDGVNTMFTTQNFTSNGDDAVFLSGTKGQTYGRARAHLDTKHTDGAVTLKAPQQAKGGYDATLTWTLAPDVTTDVNA